MGVQGLFFILTFTVCCWTVSDGKPLPEKPEKLVKDITITIHSEETSHVEGGGEDTPQRETTTAGWNCNRRVEALPSIQIYINGDCLYQQDMIIDEDTCRSIIGSSLYDCLAAQRNFIKSMV